MSLPKNGYRPDIDGLRAIAILGVILFHIERAALPGGFLGVDVFFVISGYLISGIIQRGLERGDFSFSSFYERRIRRLMPALLVLIVVVSIPCMIWMWPADLKDYAKSVKFVAISLANFHYLDVVGDYFNGHADEAPLLHTWSLAVEEQFYLVFPLLLLGLNRLFRGGRWLLVALWVLFVISISACIWRGQSSPMSCFFLLPYRAWELLAGTLLALHSFHPPGKKSAVVLGWTGLAMILASFVWVSESNLVPGLSPIPACLGAALLIYSGSFEGVATRKLLGAKVMAGLGLISYSVYLWHWPLIVFGKAIFGQSGWIGGAGVFAASILIGWLSWKYVEQPFRGRTAWSRKKVYSAWAIATLVLIFGSQFVRNARGLPGRFPEDVQALLAFEKKEGSYTMRTKEHYDPDKAPVFGDTAVEPSIAVWGDSHAEALLPVLNKMAQERKVSFRIYSVPGQIPVPGMIRKQEDNELRKHYIGRVYADLKADTAIKTVVLHARWSTPIWGAKEDGVESLPHFYEKDFRSREEVKKAYERGVDNLVAGLLSAGKRVVVIYPVPELATNVPRMLAKQRFRGEKISETVVVKDFIHRNGDVIDWFDKLPDSAMLIRIKPQKLLFEDGRVKVSDGGKPLYRDSHHLSTAGAEFLERILEPVFESGD